MKDTKKVRETKIKEKIEVGDYIDFRGVNSHRISSDIDDGKKYYFLTNGRSILSMLGFPTDEGSEYTLANKFSEVKVELVRHNPVRATSLDKLREYIDHLAQISNSIEETENEKKDRKVQKEYKKIQKYRGKMYTRASSGGFFGMPHPGFMEGMEDAVFPLLMEIDKLKKRVKKLENNGKENLTTKL